MLHFMVIGSTWNITLNSTLEQAKHMLTKTQIDAAIRNCKDETTLNDGARGRGGGSLKLRIRVGASDVSAVWFATWQKGKQRGKRQLGRYPEMSLADARTKFADDIRPLVKATARPKIAIAQQAIAPTVENLFTQYVAHLKARDAGAAGHIEQVLLLGKYNAADALGRSTLAGDVTPADVPQCLHHKPAHIV